MLSRRWRLSQRRALVAVVVLALAAPVLAGCHSREEAPTPSGASQYYTGPMKPKGAGPGKAQAPP